METSEKSGINVGFWETFGIADENFFVVRRIGNCAANYCRLTRKRFLQLLYENGIIIR